MASGIVTLVRHICYGKPLFFNTRRQSPANRTVNCSNVVVKDENPCRMHAQQSRRLSQPFGARIVLLFYANSRAIGIKRRLALRQPAEKPRSCRP